MLLCKWVVSTNGSLPIVSCLIKFEPTHPLNVPTVAVNLCSVSVVRSLYHVLRTKNMEAMSESEKGTRTESLPFKHAWYINSTVLVRTPAKETP